MNWPHPTAYQNNKTMKNWMICLLALLPALLAAQSKQQRCNEMTARADSYQRAGVLDQALSEYISALNCDTRLSSKLAKQIQDVFIKIQNEKKRIEALRDKQDQLLGYFFTDPAHSGEVLNSKGPNLAWVQNRETGKYAVIDRQGEKHGDFVWEEPQPFDNGIAIARRGGEYYFVDSVGTAASREGFDFLHETSIKPLFGVQQTSAGPLTWVLNARNGNKRERIRFLRKGFAQASEDYFPVEESKEWSLVGTDGEKLGGPYDSLGLVFDGYARAQKDSLWGFVDTRGNVPEWGELQYDAVGDFADSIAWARSGDKYHLIDLSQPQPTISLESTSRIGAYQEYFDSHIYDNLLQEKGRRSDEDKARQRWDRGKPVGAGEAIFIQEVKGKARNINLYQLNNKYFLAYGKGQSQKTPQFDEIQPVDDSLFITRQRTQEGLLVFTLDGELAELARELPCDYEAIGSYQKNPNYVRIKQDGKWGYAFWEGESSTDGKLPHRFISCQYDLATDFFRKPGFDELVARVYVARFDLYFYINTQGKMLAEIERDRIW